MYDLFVDTSRQSVNIKKYSSQHPAQNAISDADEYKHSVCIKLYSSDGSSLFEVFHEKSCSVKYRKMLKELPILDNQHN